MKNKLLPTILIAGFAVFFLSVILLNANNLNTYNSSAQTNISGYPTPVLNQSKYLYATYTCNNDPTRSSYVLMNSNRCRSGIEWKQQASNSCINKGMTLFSYKLSPECAVKPVTVTVWPTRYITPTVYPSKITPTPTVRCLACPTTYLTPTPTAQVGPWETFYPTKPPTPIGCPTPPYGCYYKGGNSYYCGEMVCAVP